MVGREGRGLGFGYWQNAKRGFFLGFFSVEGGNMNPQALALSRNASAVAAAEPTNKADQAPELGQ